MFYLVYTLSCGKFWIVETKDILEHIKKFVVNEVDKWFVIETNDVISNRYYTELNNKMKFRKDLKEYIKNNSNNLTIKELL